MGDGLQAAFQEVIAIDSDSDSEYGDRLVYRDPRERDLEAIDPLQPGQVDSYNPALLVMNPKTYEECLQAILDIFPDISRDHVQHLFDRRPSTHELPHGQSITDHLIELILEKVEYPKERNRVRDLKRKRASPEAEAAEWHVEVIKPDASTHAYIAKCRLYEQYPRVPIRFINEIFETQKHYYGAFLAIDKAARECTGSPDDPFRMIKKERSRSIYQQTLDNLECVGYDFNRLKQEIKAAEERRDKENDKRASAKHVSDQQQAKDDEHRRRREVMECACCFDDDVPHSRLTHCDSAETCHFFCFDCARRNAENDISSNKYALGCMDSSRCKATFSREQRFRFLDHASIEKLERLQQQDEIRRADMDDVASCPYCDFVAICLPVVQDKVFECRNPECMEASCRICKLKSHVPLSCVESKKANGMSERRLIEEARSEAAIRTCKKCQTRILKSEGCNKIICTSCYSMLCDYCGEDITAMGYKHFADMPGARPTAETLASGRCPLFDKNEQRKDEQVEKAGKEAMERVRYQNPGISEEDLQIKFAECVKKPVEPKGQHRHQHVPPLAHDVAQHRPAHLLPGPIAVAEGAIHRNPRANNPPAAQGHNANQPPAIAGGLLHNLPFGLGDFQHRLNQLQAAWMNGHNANAGQNMHLPEPHVNFADFLVDEAYPDPVAQGPVAEEMPRHIEDPLQSNRREQQQRAEVLRMPRAQIGLEQAQALQRQRAPKGLQDSPAMPMQRNGVPNAPNPHRGLPQNLLPRELLARQRP